MNALRLCLALALVTSTLALAPTANAIEPFCNDRTCLVSISYVVCVTEPCDGMVICVKGETFCTDDRILP